MQIVPLPSWRDLLAIFDWRTKNPNILIRPWLRDGDTGGWLSRSAWSFALIASWRIKISSERPLNVWIPDFFCNDPLEPLRKTGVKLVFYPVTEKMEPDYAECRLLSLQAPPDIFILVHFFGKPFPGGPAKDFCKLHKSWLIEDAAHVLMPVSGIGEFGDFICYSPHKLLPVPDGAVLVVRKRGVSSLSDEFINSLGGPEKWYKELDNLVSSSNLIIKRSWVFAGIWIMKRVMQKMGIKKRVHTQFFEEQTDKTKDKQRAFIQSQISSLSLRLLNRIIHSLMSVSLRRIRHHKLLNYYFTNTDESRFNGISNVYPDDVKWTPYLGVFRRTENLLSSQFGLLQKRKLNVLTWPDLSPEVINNRDNHATAWKLRHMYFYLPIHQSIRNKEFYRLLNDKDIKPDKIKKGILSQAWNETSRDQWDQLLKKVGPTNLMQSWTYGDAKSIVEGWLLHRVLFSKAGEPVAVVQLLEKKVAMLFKIIRINRGPLFLPGATDEDKCQVMSDILAMGNLWHGKLLSIAPELALTGRNLALLLSKDVYIFKPKSWSSVWIDLRSGTDQLRADLNGKWRSKLVVAEKNGMEIEKGSSPELMQWMISRYKENMKIKGFAGISIPLLQNIYANCENDCPLLIFRALKDGKPIAGLCIACHGNAATYLVGWSGNEGRQLKANHLQLWHAIQHLKAIGIEWLDLGGIDAETTPGISEFKLGIGGEKYELVGEGWKISLN